MFGHEKIKTRETKMACPTCKRFPAPTSRFDEAGLSAKRHGVLYRCKGCGQFIEVIAEERSHRLLSEEEAHTLYGPQAADEARASDRPTTDS